MLTLCWPCSVEQGKDHTHERIIMINTNITQQSNLKVKRVKPLKIGDLIASLIKRQYSIKDYGFIFPGHGGVLDRFDSVMLTAPVLFVLNTIFIF